MALLPTGFKERLEQMELCRNQRLSLLQAEKEVQFTKSQMLAAKISAIKLADHRCLNLHQQIASKHFVISSLKSRIDCLDSQYVDVLQQFRALKSEVQELEELEREKDKYFVSETKEMDRFKVQVEEFAVESRKQVQELKNQVELLKSSFVKLRGNIGSSDDSELAAAEIRKSELLAEKEDMECRLASNHQIRAQLQRQLQSILMTQSQAQRKFTHASEKRSLKLVGKSTLLTLLTGTHSEAASYEFTTLTCIPGIIHYNDTKIQLLDLPGIIEGASEGKGRGRQVIAVSKSSDIVLMVLDASKSEGHRQILTRELEAVGLRLNKRPPQIYFKKKKPGGISFNSTAQLTHVDEKLCYQILHEYKIHNAEILFREDATVDDLIDVIEGNRKYMKCIYVYNKIDVVGIDDVDRLARQPNSIVISCNLKDRGGCTVEAFSNHIHRNLVKQVKYVLVWGTSAKHNPQTCGLSHILEDEDVVQVVKNKDKQGEGRGRFKSHTTGPARISDRVKKVPLKT